MKTAEDSTQYEHNNQNKNIVHRLTSIESVASECNSSIHDYAVGFDDVNPFDSPLHQHCDPQVDIDMDPEIDCERSDPGIGAACNCLDYVNPIDILGNQNEWPSASSRFFIRDHKNQGDGLRGLVFNSVTDLKINNDFSSLTVKEMFFHLHIAAIHYGLPSTKSIDITTMMMQLNTDHSHIIQKERELMENAYRNFIVKVLKSHGLLTNQDQTQLILDEINHSVQTEWHSDFDKRTFNNLSTPVKHSTVRAVYTDGHNSIVNSLPIPTVCIAHKAAYIPANEIVNHILAMGIHCYRKYSCSYS